MISKTALFILLAFAIFCCKKGEDENPDHIKYGISFRICNDYCVHEITITGNTITYTDSPWEDNPDNLSPVQCSFSFSDSLFNDLKTKIDPSQFQTLPETYGCPDCQGNGSEWVMIKIGEIEHKVTFEYQNEPDPLRNYIDKLRDYFDRYNDCQGS